jgi:uncharacterized protein (TIGR00730 family)
MIKTICLFCGSSVGGDPFYQASAKRLAVFLLDQKINLVYGGANVGLMHVVAETMLKGGGNVTGVIPKNLVQRNVAHPGLTRMCIVDNMLERKVQMAKLSDGFITLPGGFGTFDELFEMLSWNQLHLQEKPIGLLNVNGYFNPMLKMIDKAIEEKFLRVEHREILMTEEDEAVLFERMNDYKPVKAEKWIEHLKSGSI